jgi:hypothetical protein
MSAASLKLIGEAVALNIVAMWALSGLGLVRCDCCAEGRDAGGVVSSDVTSWDYWGSHGENLNRCGRDRCGGR